MNLSISILTQKFREDTNREEWALVTKNADKRTGHRRVLKWFGPKKPSDKEYAKEEARINYFAKIHGSADYSDTCYSCFLFENEDHDDLHITHKYFGKLDKNQILEVCSILDDWFSKYPFEEFSIKFDEEAFFGKENDVRVLTFGSLPKPDWKHFRIALRDKFSKFRKDDFPYCPHVTTNEKIIDKPIVGYAFIHNGIILREYRMSILKKIGPKVTAALVEYYPDEITEIVDQYLCSNFRKYGLVSKDCPEIATFYLLGELGSSTNPRWDLVSGRYNVSKESAEQLLQDLDFRYKNLREVFEKYNDVEFLEYDKSTQKIGKISRT